MKIATVGIDLAKNLVRVRGVARSGYHTYMVAPGLPSNQMVNKKVGIAAIHPDFGAAKPLSLMECAGRIPEQPHELFGSLCELGPPATVLPVLPSPIDRLCNSPLWG